MRQRLFDYFAVVVLLGLVILTPLYASDSSASGALWVLKVIHHALFCFVIFINLERGRKSP